MGDLPKSGWLLSQVSVRLRATSFAGHFFFSFLLCTGIYGLVLLVARFLGWLPVFAPAFVEYAPPDGGWFGWTGFRSLPSSLLAIPVGAAVIARIDDSVTG